LGWTFHGQRISKEESTLMALEAGEAVGWKIKGRGTWEVRLDDPRGGKEREPFGATFRQLGGEGVGKSEAFYVPIFRKEGGREGRKKGGGENRSKNRKRRFGTTTIKPGKLRKGKV